MANILNFCRSVLQYSYNAASAVATFNHRLVSWLIRGTAEFYVATTTVVKGIGSALNEILFYLFDLVEEAWNVFVVCGRLTWKSLVLVYHIVASLVTAIVMGLQLLGNAISQGIALLLAGLKSASESLSNAWQKAGPGVTKWTSEAVESVTSFGERIMCTFTSSFSSCIINCVQALNYAGEKFNDLAIYLLENAYAAFASIGNNLHEFVCANFSNLSTIGGSFLETLLTPFCYSMKQIKNGYNVIYNWTKPSVPNIPTVVYLYILVTTLIIILFKIVMGHMTRHGLSVPFLNFSASRPNRVIRNRHRFVIDSSDEESMYEEEIIEEEVNDDEYEDDYEDRYHRGLEDDDNMSISDSSDEEDSLDSGASDEQGSEEGFLEVLEYEVASDSDSDAESEAPIQIELPDREGRYNLRTRMSPPPATLDPNGLSPSDLERLLENERDKRLCVVCQSQPKNVLVLPCRHMCLCVDCAHEIANQRTRARRVCPLCRARIETVMNVYI